MGTVSRRRCLFLKDSAQVRPPQCGVNSDSLYAATRGLQTSPDPRRQGRVAMWLELVLLPLHGLLVALAGTRLPVAAAATSHVGPRTAIWG